MSTSTTSEYVQVAWRLLPLRGRLCYVLLCIYTDGGRWHHIPGVYMYVLCNYCTGIVSILCMYLVSNELRVNIVLVHIFQMYNLLPCFLVQYQSDYKYRGRLIDSTYM